MYCFQKPSVRYSFAFCSSSSEKQAVKSENMALAVILSPGPQKIVQKAPGHAWTRSNTPNVLRPSRNLQNIIKLLKINKLYFIALYPCLQKSFRLTKVDTKFWGDGEGYGSCWQISVFKKKCLHSVASARMEPG